MSSASRSTSRGGKGAKQDASVANKQQKTDTKTDNPKTLDHNPKIQPTAEQMRMAQIIETKTEDPDLRDKIKQVMDATRKTEDEVCTALHDCDNDPDRAVNLLLEGAGTGEWETSGKKKKNRQANASKSETVQNNREAEQEDWEGGQGFNTDRERTRNRGGGPPRMRGRGSLDNRGWRGRENKENEKNLEEGRDGYRRGTGRMVNGPRSGRGGRGGRVGPRTFQNRDKGGFPRSIETWNNPSTEENSGGDAIKMEKWGDDFPSPEDWDNEEYTGSLADTKVFTPSAAVAVEPTPNSEVQPEATTTTVTVTELTSSLAAQTLSSSVASSSSQMSSQNLDLHQQTSQLSQSPVPVGVNTLNATPSEYLSQFTQSAESLKAAVGIGTSAPASATSYGTTSNSFPVTSTGYPAPSPPTGFTSTSASFSTSNYVGTTANYTGQIPEQNLDTTTSSAQCPPQSMPQRTKTARPRVPPPSKIPATAVEMPGDAINNIGYLDVQFGGLEFGSESSFDATPEPTKYPNNTSGSVLDSLPSPRTTSNLDLSGNSQTPSLDAYAAASSQKQPQQSLSSSLSQTQKLSTGDSILPTTEHKTTQPSFPQSRGTSSAGLDIDKSEVGLPYSTPSTATYPASYPNQKSSGSSYPTASSYSSSNFSSTQVTTSAPTYQTNQSQMSYTSSGTGSNYSSQTAAPSSYPSSSYSQASAAGVTYQTGPTSYPSITQSTNSFPSASPAYQTTGQSVYGASTLGNSTAYAVSVAAGQYQNNYGANVATTAQNHTKLSSALSTGTKEPQYDTTTTTVASNLTSTNATTTNSGLSTVNATPTLGLAASSSSQTVNTTTTKVTSSTGKSGVVPNIPPGVPPMLGTQYIMSQGGLPYFQQPMYSYEDLQLLQQRIPHMATGYYDMGFQAPTSLATGREGGLASVAYSMSDGRYTRADNNASPVPSTLSQQNATQAHQQPMLNPTALPPGYAYFYGGGMMPGGFQYGTPAIYPMQPPATNTHGSTTTTQYPKPGSYGSGYGSGYDGLSQNQDYSKTGYVSGSQSQTKAGVGANAGTTGSSASDLSAVYGKSHVALGKVNSYEKQGFHSGTPPPFNLPGSQNTPMAPSGAYAPHLFIPTMAPHQQHHSTTLMHQPLHQMEMRNPGRRSETGSSSNQRSQSSTQPNKSGTKQGYSPSYWTPN